MHEKLIQEKLKGNLYFLQKKQNKKKECCTFPAKSEMTLLRASYILFILLEIEYILLSLNKWREIYDKSIPIMKKQRKQMLENIQKNFNWHGRTGSTGGKVQLSPSPPKFIVLRSRRFSTRCFHF